MIRRRKKLNFIKITAAVLIIVTALVSVTCLSNGDRGKYAYYTEVYVKPGDTLWEIAAENYGTSVDLRKGVYAIMECSGITSGDIYVGQKLLVPEL